MKPALMQHMKKQWKPNVNTKHKKDAPCNPAGCAVEDLLAEANLANEAFKSLFQHFVANTRCDTGLYELWGKASVMDAQGNKKYVTTQTGRIIMEKKKRKVTSYGSLKGAPRIEQKCLTKYKNRAAQTHKSPARYINDVVRGTICFKNCADMLDALIYIKSKENKPVAGLNFKYSVVSIKQIYEPKSPLLYGDIKLNIQMSIPNTVTHNCELQLNHLEMIKAKGSTAGHGAYEDWRNMDDEHWKNKGSELPNKIENMKGEYQRRAKEIVRTSQGAYADAAKALSRDNEYKPLLDEVKKWGAEIKQKVNQHTIKFYDGTYTM